MRDCIIQMEEDTLMPFLAQIQEREQQEELQEESSREGFSDEETPLIRPRPTYAKANTPPPRSISRPNFDPSMFRSLTPISSASRPLTPILTEFVPPPEGTPHAWIVKDIVHILNLIVTIVIFTLAIVKEMYKEQVE